VPAALLDATLDRITSLDLLDGLVPILRKVPETGSRIYQRLATIFDAAVIDRLRPDNPATPIRRELRKRAGPRRRDNLCDAGQVGIAPRSRPWQHRVAVGAVGRTRP
jgi:hypothetical protein